MRVRGEQAYFLICLLPQIALLSSPTGVYVSDSFSGSRCHQALN